MTAQITGYTMSVLNVDGEHVFDAPAGIVANPADLDYEQAMWDAMDVMAAYFATARPETAPFSTRLVRHEKEDVVITHP